MQPSLRINVWDGGCSMAGLQFQLEKDKPAKLQYYWYIIIIRKEGFQFEQNICYVNKPLISVSIYNPNK